MQISRQFIKKNRHKKENYRPVSSIFVISKIFEHCLYDRIYKKIDNKLSRHKIGYRKGYSSQHSLVAMFEKKKEIIDKGGRMWCFICGFI